MRAASLHRTTSCTIARTNTPRCRVAAPPRALATGALILSDDERLARACVRALAPLARTVIVLHETRETTPRSDVIAVSSAGGDAFALACDGEAAATVAADSDGLAARALGGCGACVVATREATLGEDGETKRSMRAARRAAVVGLPTVVFSAPRGRGGEEDDDARCEALAVVFRALTENVLTDNYSARNVPRAHFPFPTRGRWAALGSEQLRMDDALAADVLSTSGEDFATADCWSLGGSGATPHVGPTTSASKTEDPESMREALREAFRDGDVFIAVNAPPSWTRMGKRFSATRPGVYWRQQRVEAIDVDGEAEVTDASVDVFGRTLPVQDLSSTTTSRASERGARFVRQLATERVVAERAPKSSDATPPDARATRVPSAFRLVAGVVVADDSPRGDLDAFAAGRASVCLRQTFPRGHAFEMLDAPCVEHMRETENGLPRWLADARR